MSHTPEPWSTGQSTGPTRGHVTARRPDGGLTLIAGVTTHPLPDAEWRANACLIAAAPELLVALEEIVERCRHATLPDTMTPGEVVVAVQRIARAAITKARGDAA